MTSSISAPARISLRGHEAIPARLDVIPRSGRTRLTRAVLALLGFWMLAPLVFFLPPHLPWALGAVTAGVYFAFRQWSGELVVTAFEGSCPRCGAALAIPSEARIRLPHTMNCFACHHQPVLELDPVRS